MKKLMKKIAVSIVGLSMVLIMSPVQGATVEELETQIADLLAQIEALQTQLTALGGAPAAACTFTRNLYPGMSGADVKCLQQYLNGAGYTVAASGAGSAGNETEYYGSLTQAAVGAWQDANGVAYGAYKGYFGPVSQAKFTAVAPAEEEEEEEEEALEGGAGSITITALSTYGAETVGENESDVKVSAFEIKADSESDVDITSMKIELNEQDTGDSEDIDDYAESVSIWMGSENVGEVDADEFSESGDNVWTKSISLDNAIVRAGETEEFFLVITALPNLDTGDMDSDDWQIGVSNIRFKDGEGVVTTESLTLDIDDNVVDDTVEEEFDFASFATAANVELKVALNDDDDDINEAHVINVESGTTDTDDVKILSFTLEADGSDINIDQIPVLITTTGETDESAIIKSTHLLHDGEEITTESVTAGGAVTFDDLDIDINDGDIEEFMVTVDLQDLTGALDVGDTVKVELTATEVNAIVAEDESGEDLGAADLTGTAAGEASEVRDVSFNVELESATAVKSHAGDISNTSDSDQGTFTITFSVTAFDGSIYIDGTKPIEAGGNNECDLDVVGTDNYIDSSITSPTGATMSGEINADARFLVKEDDTERFTITFVTEAYADGLFQVSLENIRYALTDTDGDISYTFGLEDFVTDSLSMQNDAD